MAFVLESPAFKDGEMIPRRHACDGEDLSPPLRWTDPPAGTKSLALICEDSDAPVMTWIHWVVPFIPPDRRELNEGIPAKETVEGLKQANNSWKRIGWGGPCPPGNKAHRYFFRLYALDSVVEMRSSEGRRGLDRAMSGHMMAETHLMGRYQRA